VLIIDAGRLIYDGPLQTIKERFGTHRILSVETVNEIRTIDAPAGSEVVTCEGRSVVLRFDRGSTTASRVAAALMDQIEVVDFTLTEPDLTSIVRQIYGGALGRVETA